MLGYNYETIYKKGKGIAVVYVLSRKYEDEGSLFSLSSPILEWVKEVCQEWPTHDFIA